LGEAPKGRKSAKKQYNRIFHTWMSKRILGRTKETKVTDMRFNWLYAGLAKNASH
jgi:hypothetical protein